MLQLKYPITGSPGVYVLCMTFSGLMVAIMRGMASPDAIEKAWGHDKVRTLIQD